MPLEQTIPAHGGVKLNACDKVGPGAVQKPLDIAGASITLAGASGVDISTTGGMNLYCSPVVTGTMTINGSFFVNGTKADINVPTTINGTFTVNGVGNVIIGAPNVRFHATTGEFSVAMSGEYVLTIQADRTTRFDRPVQIFATTAANLINYYPCSAATAGRRAFVTDCNIPHTAANVGSSFGGGGSYKVPAYDNGTQWLLG
jgi:hypothetical protein